MGLLSNLGAGGFSYKDDYKSYYDYDIDQGQLKLWYQAQPYCFRVTPREGTSLSFYLPLSPSNLTISTHFATNVIATAYGTVEEHSEQRYFDIVIAGTTGMAPKHSDIHEEGFWSWTQQQVLSGRDSSPIYTLLDTGGFFNRTRALLENSFNKAVSLFGDSDTYTSGISYSNTGYAAFHNFYRFLLAHKKEILGETSDTRWQNNTHPIRFINYKDNNQYNVAIQTFQLTRSVDDPMLYKYNIVMRAYRLSNIDAPDTLIDSDKVHELGLDGVDSLSIRAKLSNKVRNAKSALASTVAAVKGFGS